MKTLGKIALIAGLGAGLASVAQAQEISPFASLFDPAHDAGPTGRHTSQDFGPDGLRSGRSAAVPNRNAIGQGVGRD